MKASDIPSKAQVVAGELQRHLRGIQSQLRTLREMAASIDDNSAGAYRVRCGIVDADDAIDHACDGIVAAYEIDP